MKLVLGTVQFGLEYGINSQGRPSEQAVGQILKYASDNGIEILDTSAGYGNSEKVLGAVVPMSGGKFKIISKYPENPHSVKVALTETLDKLGVETIYGYLLHHFEVYKDNPSVWREFEEVKRENKVDKIGFSLYSHRELELIFERDDKFDLVQFPYNIFDRQFEPYLKELKNRGVEIHVRSTFLQGLLFKNVDALPEKLKPLKKYLIELNEYAEKEELSVAQVALNYNLQNKNIDGVLVGVDNVAQLQENIEAICNRTIDLNIDVKEKELLNPVNWK